MVINCDKRYGRDQRNYLTFMLCTFLAKNIGTEISTFLDNEVQVHNSALFRADIDICAI